MCFQTEKERVTKNQITYIQIDHRWASDRLSIQLVDGSGLFIEEENKKISVMENGERREYALCKLDYIEVDR